MKFGKYLQENQISAWKDYYVHYKSLKKFIAMAELHIDQGISNQDEKYFVDKVEENVRRIEQWFLKVRNKCFERFEDVQKDLPKEIKSHLPCISEFTSFQQYTKRKGGTSDDMDNAGNKSPKKKKKLKRRKSSRDDNDSRSTSSKSKKSRHKSKKSKSRHSTDTQSVTTSSSAPSSKDVKGGQAQRSLSASNTNEDDRVHVKDRVHVIDIQHNDQQQIDEEEQKGDGDNNDDMEMNTFGDDQDECSTPLSSSEEAYDQVSDDRDRDDDDNEHKYDLNDDQDEESFKEKYLRRNIDGDLIFPPTTLFIENAVFSHLPPSAHRECLSILLTLGKLKLFAWQNSEGVRKIIKKFDKRFSKTLSSTLWPKIKLNEFVQETKNDSYIAQVAAVLCTRTIPFGHLDANDLREKGVNLKQMADSIQQLENVVAEDDLKEIVPMNVEPRSYLANERTFLKWMRMAALTTLVGMILLGMRHEPVTGIFLIILSIGVLLRSYIVYYKRNEVLVNRIAYGWVDHLGAKLLLLSLFIPMITYLVYLVLYGSTTNMFHK